MAGPWEDYQPKATTNAGPWTEYAPTSPSVTPESPTSFKNIAGAAVEPSLSLMTGAAAQPIAGLRGLAHVLGNQLGVLKSDPQAVIEQTQRALTYQPKTQGGQTAFGAITYPLELYGKGARYVGEKAADLVGPKTGATIETAIQAAPMALGVRKPQPPTMPPKPTVRQQTFLDAQKLGYVAPPASLRPSFLNTKLESLGGKAMIGQAAAGRNNALTNRLMAKELGLPEGVEVTESTLNAYRQAMAGPYRQVAKLSPLVEKSLERLKEGRADAKDLWATYAREPKPSNRKAAMQQDAINEMRERAIEKVAIKYGHPQLVQELREARKAIAKSYDIEKALNIGSSEIDAHLIGRQLDKGKPLTGNLRTVGRFAEAFPSETRTGVHRAGVSGTDAGMAALLAEGGVLALNSPYGLALGALPLVRGGARSLALSPWYQSRFTVPQTNLKTTLPQAAQQAALMSILSGQGRP